MADSKTIIELAKKNNGTLTTAMVVEAGFSRGSLKYLSDTGQLEKVSRGVYTLPDVWEDEFVSIQNRYKRGVYSLDTALFLCDLTDRTPARFHMVFPATYNLTGPKGNGIICSGITELNSPSGNIVKSYSAERTLCDILKTRNHTDIQIISDAFKRYTSRKQWNIPMLSEYAKRLRVEERLKSYLEVLL